MTETTLNFGSGNEYPLPLSLLNRHMLVSGATGSGKTVSLLGIAQRLSDAGIPVFFPDVKGDVATKLAGVVPCRMLRSFRVGARYVSADLMARALSLTDVQAGTLEIVWSMLPGDDVAAIRAAVRRLSAEPGIAADLGRVSAASCGVILRSLLAFERRGGSALLGSPSFDVASLLDMDSDGRGIVSILPAEGISRDSGLYSLALLYVLSELFERLPEVGDLDLPRAMLVFDEAHLIFADAPKDMVRSIARMVRLIRSKGIGLIFCSQSPADIPSEILSQLAARVQHGLRAASPADARALKVAADTMPAGRFDMGATIRRLGTGQAVVSTLDSRGVALPSVVTPMRPPRVAASPIDAASLPDVPTKAQPGARPTVESRPSDLWLGLGFVVGVLGVLLAAVRYAIS